MALISEETCATCKWKKHDSGDSNGTYGCCNPNSPDYMEDVSWQYSCFEWENENDG